MGCLFLNRIFVKGEISGIIFNVFCKLIVALTFLMRVVCSHYQYSFLMFYSILLFIFYMFCIFLNERQNKDRKKRKKQTNKENKKS